MNPPIPPTIREAAPAAFDRIRALVLAGWSVRHIVSELNRPMTGFAPVRGARWHIRSVQLAIEQLRESGEVPREVVNPIHRPHAPGRLPRRTLVGTEDSFDAQDDAWRAAGYPSWCAWVRDAIEEKLRRAP